MGGFRRSGTFGIAGVFVVAGVVAAIALTMKGDWLCDLWLAERLAGALAA